MTSNAERAALLVRALEVSIGGDTRLIAELYVDDVTGRASALDVRSAAELAVELEDRRDAFTNLVLDVSPLDVSGDRACVEWTARLTHSGPYVIDDDVVVEPTGQRVTLTGITVAEFDGDRIRSFRQYFDEGALLGQLMGRSDPPDST